ncbi:MAG: arginine--tRNA ligase [Thiohalomonadales bacterium]
MNRLSQLLHSRLQQAIAQSFGDDYRQIDPLLRPTQDPKFGDFQSNVAMSLAKRLQRNPREVATDIISAAKLDDICESAQIAGPGFINLRFLPTAISQQLVNLLTDSRLGVNPRETSQTVVVDYSGPNVAKEMHVGHLRSTVIGDAIAQVLAFLGDRVIRQNHIGDWGTQFGMLTEYLIETQWKPSKNTDQSDLNTLYRESKCRFDADPEFAQRSRQRVVALQGGDAQTLQLWRQLVTESRAYISAVYWRLESSMTDADTRGESSYNDLLAPMIDELKQKGLTQQDQGATVVFLDEFCGRDKKPLPLIVQKSDQGFLYATTDLACLRYRIRDLHAERIIYITDARQKQHFAMVFKTAEKVGWLGSTVSAEHVAFGAVLGEDGKPFKTRSGETIRLVALIEEAERRALEIVRQKNPGLGEAEQNDISKAVAIAAIKYADLSGDRVKDYVFSWERMLAMEGNTAPYLQYVYSRVRSIFRKGITQGGGDIKLSDMTEIQLDSLVEKQLGLKILQLDDVLGQVAERLEPHRLCTYLFELATQFNSFYEACPVLKADSLNQTKSRLILCDLTARTIALGLGLLNIRVLEKM